MNKSVHLKCYPFIQSTTNPMKTTLLPLLILCFNFGTYAQTNTGKFSIGLTTSIDKIINEKFVPIDKYNGYSTVYDQANYRLGLVVEYAINSKFSLKSGVNYANRNFTGTIYCGLCDFLTLELPQKIELRAVELPLTAKYNYHPKRIGAFAEVGVNNAFVLQRTAKQNGYNLSVKIGGGVQYSLAEKTSLQMGIDYTNGVSKLYKESSFKLKTLGLGIGLMRRL